jgi:hypothetical protein
MLVFQRDACCRTILRDKGLRIASRITACWSANCAFWSLPLQQWMEVTHEKEMNGFFFTVSTTSALIILNEFWCLICKFAFILPWTSTRSIELSTWGILMDATCIYDARIECSLLIVFSQMYSEFLDFQIVTKGSWCHIACHQASCRVTAHTHNKTALLDMVDSMQAVIYTLWGFLDAYSLWRKHFSLPSVIKEPSKNYRLWSCRLGCKLLYFFTADHDV